MHSGVFNRFNRVCQGCGGAFTATHIRQFNCNPACRGAKLTAEDWRVYEEWYSLCKRYRLANQKVFTYITGCGSYICRMIFRKKRLRPFSRTTIDRYVTILRKFTTDFRAGYYNVRYVARGIDEGRFSGHVTRRLQPRKPECPRNAFRCQGGLFPTDCRRQWKECSLHSFASVRVEYQPPNGWDAILEP